MIRIRPILRVFAAIALAASIIARANAAEPHCFAGKHFRGCGDIEHVRLLDTARRMFEPDPELQNLSMLYTPEWNGLVEGPTWNMWWIQNSYGTTYAALPFLQEPFLRFLQNSQDLWFDQMGDGKRHGCPGQPRDNWVAPDGQLCDAAAARVHHLQARRRPDRDSRLGYRVHCGGDRARSRNSC